MWQTENAKVKNVLEASVVAVLRSIVHWHHVPVVVVWILVLLVEVVVIVQWEQGLQ